MIFSFFYLIILFYLIIWDVSSYNLMISFILFICPADSSIGDLVTDSLSHQLLILEHTMVDLWPLKLLIRVMRKHDLSKKIQRQRKRRWERRIHLDNTFKEQWQWQWQWQRQWQWQIHLDNTLFRVLSKSHILNLRLIWYFQDSFRFFIFWICLIFSYFVSLQCVFNCRDLLRFLGQKLLHLPYKVRKPVLYTKY